MQVAEDQPGKKIYIIILKSISLLSSNMSEVRFTLFILIKKNTLIVTHH